MPTRRRPKGSVEDLLPKDRVRWARELWADREACAASGDLWPLREAAKILGLPEEGVDELAYAARSKAHSSGNN